MDADIATSPEATASPSVSIIGSESVHEFIRYFVASGAALIVDIGSLLFLISIIEISYLFSGAIAFTCGLVTVYILSVYWVFSARSLRSPTTEFSVFVAIGLVGLVLNEIFLFVFTGIFGWFYLVSKCMSVIVVFSWNFAARKYLLFR